MNYCNKLNYWLNARFFLKNFFRMLFFIVVFFEATAAKAIGNCPAIGQSSSCSVLITINPNGSLKFQTDPSIGPYDGSEDTLVGVQNLSGATVFGISLTGNNIFGFDGDGAAQNGGYAGPGISFSSIDKNNGTVNFDNGLDNNGFIWFSLESSPSQVKLSSSVTIDPGHGFNCGSINENIGAIGNINYPPNNPPSGFMYEDNLTVSIASELNNQLTASRYNVNMTKSDANTCVSLKERGNKANAAKSNIFVSIHINSAGMLPIPLPTSLDFFKYNGSSVIYNPAKTSSKSLADLTVVQLASSLGVNNRGSVADDTGIAVLKITTTRMTSILTEVARLSNPDSDILHAVGASSKAASGIKAGIDAFMNQ